MIAGLGIDIVEVARLQTSLDALGEAFIRRIAHPCEVKLEPKNAKRKAEYWAARFAAKEAFAKALGTGMGKDVAFKQVGVEKKTSGAPYLKFDPKLKALLRKRKITNSHLSISHTDHTAIAIVILEGA